MSKDDKGHGSNKRYSGGTVRSSENEQEYLYHETHSFLLPSIKSSGLNPFAKSQSHNTKEHGVIYLGKKDMHDEVKKDLAKSYLVGQNSMSEKTHSAFLRIRKEHLDKKHLSSNKVFHEHLPESESNPSFHTYSKNIRPEQIEVRNNKGGYNPLV